MTEQYSTDDIFDAITLQLKKDFKGSKNIEAYYEDSGALCFVINNIRSLHLECYDKNREIHVYRRSLEGVIMINVDCDSVYLDLKKIILEEAKIIKEEEKAKTKALIKKQKEFKKKYKLNTKSILEILRIKK